MKTVRLSPSVCSNSIEGHYKGLLSWVTETPLYFKAEEPVPRQSVWSTVLFTDSSFGKENMFRLVVSLVTDWLDPQSVNV